MRRPGSVDLILGATVLIWAFNVTVTKYVLTHGFQPLAYGAIRYGAAALLAVDRRADHGHDADLHGDRRVDRRARAADTRVLDRDRGRVHRGGHGRAGI